MPVGTVVRLVATLTGGVLADRHRRIVMMVLGAALAIVAAGAFTAVALAGGLDFVGLLLFEVLLAAVSGLFSPAGEAALKDIVPAQLMGRAQAANQGRDAALQLAGGPIGGILLAAGGFDVSGVSEAVQKGMPPLFHRIARGVAVAP